MFAWDTANVYEDAIVHEIIRQPIAVYGDTFFGTCSPQIPEEYRKNMNPKIKSLLECSDETDRGRVYAEIIGRRPCIGNRFFWITKLHLIFKTAGG